MHRVGLRRLAALVGVIGVVLVGVLAAPTAALSGPLVKIKTTGVNTYRFAPRTVDVTPGTTVHWRWSGTAPHNVTFPDLGKGSATGDDGTFKLRFNNAGTYHYLCTVHGFKGVVTVG
jgi:plastocyanin